MDTFRASGAKSELFWLEGFSDGQDVESDPESDNEKSCSDSESDVSTCGWVSGFVSSKLVVFLLGLGAMWRGCYFTYLGSLPRIAFGRREAEDFAISSAGIFTMSFVFFLLLLIPWSRVFEVATFFDTLMKPVSFLIVAVICLVIWTVHSVLGDIIDYSSTWLLLSNTLYAVILAITHAYRVPFVLWAQRYFHAPIVAGFVEALNGLG